MKPVRRLTKATVPDPAAGQEQLPATGQVAGNGTVASSQPAPARAKLTIRMDVEDLGRARTAWRISCAQPGSDYPTFGQWVAALLMQATEAIEADHNGGRPLAPTPAGVLPTGNAARR
ncbi:hypothetical protein [Actinomyces howellii]|uniref:Centromere-binding protein ParB C-terminal domain-containing protein n=1 Tax=Actinomyces howellii TaxID=52771 RepID=A0A448HK44_9ACTO|nr:hypothetical protein [Actinomyces howellii]VEG29988.1 Uncharacterised protein [Actinomyces howellii]